MIFGTGMEKAKISCTKTIGKGSALEHLQHHLVKDNAFLRGFALPRAFQPCTACSCCSNFGFRRHNVQGRLIQVTAFSTQGSLLPSQCSIIILELDASIHAGFSTAGLAIPNGHVQQSDVSIRGKCGTIFTANCNREKLQVQSCILSAERILSRDNFLPPSGP